MIRSISKNDAKQICDIYNHYIDKSTITFEEVQVSVEEMQRRISSSTLPWLVYEEDQKILGYAYAGQWKGRAAYRHSAEVTIYLKHNAAGKGIGTKLYSNLIDQLKALKFHVLMGGIALPNDASIALHEKLGFQKVAHFKEVGFKFNQWIDVAYWQLFIH